MTCDMTTRLLEADVLPITDGVLAEHVTSCRECQRALALFEEAYAHLDDYLAGHPPVDAAQIVAAAQGGHQPSRWGPWRRHAWLPLALAATVAAVFLGGRGDAPPSVGIAEVSSPSRSPAGLDVETDLDVAVLQTTNPDITVLWFFAGE